MGGRVEPQVSGSARVCLRARAPLGGGLRPRAFRRGGLGSPGEGAPGYAKNERVIGLRVELFISGIIMG